MNSVKRSFPFWVPLLFGLMGLSREIGNPRLQSVRVADILQITTSRIFWAQAGCSAISIPSKRATTAATCASGSPATPPTWRPASPRRRSPDS